MKRRVNAYAPHETDTSLVWLDVSSPSRPGFQTLVDRALLDVILSPPFGGWRIHEMDGGPNSRFYVVGEVWDTASKKSRRVLLHRAVLGLKPGDGVYTSHLNHNTLDNRLCNLEATTQRRNLRHGMNGKPPKGRYRTDRGTWEVKILVARCRVSLGCFKSEAEAASAYALANKIADGAALDNVTLTRAGLRACMGIQ